MCMLRAPRRLMGLMLLSFAVPLLIGCQRDGTSPSASSGPGLATRKEPTPERRIREQLPAAAGMPIRALDTIIASASSPPLSRMEDQSLTMLLLFLDAEPPTPEAAAEFHRESTDPASLVELVTRSRDEGYATVVRLDEIDEFTCLVEGDRATGTVTFHMGAILRAKVGYEAARDGETWRIETFKLPAWGLTTQRGEDGFWKATGELVEFP